MRRATLALAALIAIACSPYELVGPRLDRPAALGVMVHLTDEPIPRREVRAVMYMGLDGRGRLIQPSDRRMFVGAVAIEPHEDPDEPGVLHYLWQPPSAALMVPALQIRAPAIGSHAPTVTVPISFRAGGEELSVVVGEDVELRLSTGGPASPNVTTSSEGWRLSLGRSCSSGGGARQLTTAATPVPPVLHIPVGYLAELPRDSVAACYGAFSRHQTSGSYVVDVMATITAHWRIRIVDAPASSTRAGARPSG